MSFNLKGANMFWKNADQSELISYQAMSLLFGHNENLLHYLLNPDQPRLIRPSEIIKYNSGVLSSGENLLINIGLDIWDGSGGIHFNDLYQKLDDKNFQKMLQALLFLRSPQMAVLF